MTPSPHRPTRRHAGRLALGGLLGASSLLLINAQESSTVAPSDLIPNEAQSAIDRGLALLSRLQGPDGGYDDQNGANVAITGLSGLALMAGGYQPARGLYGRTVSRAMDALLIRSASGNPAGYLNGTDFGGHGGGMYQHGFATLFLAELYGMLPRADRQQRLRDALERAIAVIVRSQNKLGGWRYDPRPSEADVSVTVAQLMALRAARNAGIFVPKSTVDAAVQYIKGCQLEDGGFCYILGQREVGSAFARSAAAVVGLFSAGIYQGPEIDRGLRYLMQFIPNGRNGGFRDMRGERYYFYAHYYAALAMWTAGGQYWSAWFPAIRDDLIERNRVNGGLGGWLDISHGAAYATAMACIILQLPNNYLPILQK